MIGDKGAASRVGAPSLGTLVVIASAIGVLALAFAYIGGWLSPGRLTPDRMVAALSDRGGNPLGHRRNHAKGICFTGEFDANGAGAGLSTAPMLTAGRYPVIGRFAIAVGNPDAPDATGRVRSMAVRIVAPDAEEWRSGMNNSPVFVVATPQAFYEVTLTQDIDPATGKTEPRRDGALSQHPPRERTVRRMGQDRPLDHQLRRSDLQQPQCVPLCRRAKRQPSGALVHAIDDATA